MAFEFNYTSLITQLAEWTNRNDTVFLNQCPIFITLAEQLLFQDFTSLGNESAMVGEFAPGNGVIPKPALWGDTLTFSYLDSLGNITILKRVPYEYARQYIDNPSTQNTQVTPLYYTDYGFNNWLVVPSPQEAFKFEVIYLNKVTPLAASQPTNWETQNAYDLLFAACLIYAYQYLTNSALEQQWQQTYTQRLQAYILYDKNRKTDRNVNALKD